MSNYIHNYEIYQRMNLAKKRNSLTEYIDKMPRISSQAARHIVSVIIAALAVSSLLFTLEGIYSVISNVIPLLPSFDQPVATLLVSPYFWIFGVLCVAATTTYGYRRFGTLLGFFVSCIKVADTALGNIVFDEPAVRGRVVAEDVAWTVNYWKDGRIRAINRCCPQCGSELDQRLLPAEVVHSSNEGFNPNEEQKQAETDAWADIHGAPKSESTREILALACTLCRFRIPGRKEIQEGKSTAEKIFQTHIERMKSGNPRRNSFAEYEQAADKNNNNAGKNLGPEGIWDAYVATCDDPELIAFSVESDRPVDRSNA